VIPYPELLARYRKRHGKLVEPVQGFGSLHNSLHLAYSMGRQRGFTDLGTYVNKPGDHGWNDKERMAAAFLAVPHRHPHHDDPEMRRRSWRPRL